MSQIGPFLMMLLLAGVSVFMILIILLQRGRGGGLAGAFGGAGGQSAFGNKAGDAFTKFTIGLAVGWIAVACISNFVLKSGSELYPGDDDEEVVDAADEDAGDGPTLDAGPGSKPVIPPPAGDDPFGLSTPAPPAETATFPPVAGDEADDADGPRLLPADTPEGEEQERPTGTLETETEITPAVDADPEGGDDGGEG